MLLATTTTAMAQVTWVEEFNDNTLPDANFVDYNTDGGGLNRGNWIECNGKLQINSAGNDEWEYVDIHINNGTDTDTLDLSETAQLSFRVRSTTDSAVFRINLVDDNGNESQNDFINNNPADGSGYHFSIGNFWQTVTVDFNMNWWNQYGGGAQTDSTNITTVRFRINPGFFSFPVDDQWGTTHNSTFNGTLEIDWIAINMTGTNNATDGCTTVGIEEETIENSIAIAPVPAQDHVTIAFKAIAETDVVVTDLLGNVIDTRKANKGANNIQFNTSSMSSGMYLISIVTADGLVTRKIVVE